MVFFRFPFHSQKLSFTSLQTLEQIKERRCHLTCCHRECEADMLSQLGSAMNKNIPHIKEKKQTILMSWLSVLPTDIQVK